MIDHGMLPFLLPLGNTESSALTLQYGYLNYNQISPHIVHEIANNFAGNPMEFQSGHDRVMDQGFELVIYQSNEVCFCSYFYIDEQKSPVIFYLPNLTHIFVSSYHLLIGQKIAKRVFSTNESNYNYEYHLTSFCVYIIV